MKCLLTITVVFSWLLVNSQDADTASVSAQQIVDVISSPNAVEYAPSISADGKTIIYESNRDGYYKLYESVKDEAGNWSEPVPLTSVNSFGDSTDLIGGPSISFDGNTLYFFASIGIGESEDIYVSNRTLDGWSTPEKLPSPINTSGYEAFPSISADGRELYFVRLNEEGPSDRDLARQDLFCTSIFRSSRQSDGTWGEPIKLPPPINVDCEKAPKIMADGKTLVFSSNRPGGLGDYDMYQSKLNVLGEWLSAVPLTYVNTPNSDQLPSISASGDLMYFTYNNRDIYTVPIPQELRQFMNNVMTGNITDRDSGEGIAASVIVRDAFTSEEIMRLNNNPATGAYSVVVPVGGTYNIEMISEGYSSYVTSLDLRNVDTYRETSMDVSLFKTARLELKIIDSELFVPVDAMISVTNRAGEVVKEETADIRSGSALLDLPVGDRYEIHIDKENFHSRSLSFDLTGLVMYRDFGEDIELAPEKVEVAVNVQDLSNNSRVKSKVRLINRDRNEVIEVEGNQLVSLRAGDRYEVEVTSDQGYAFNSTVLNLQEDQVEELTLKLQKLEKDALLTLRDILFESNSSQLSEISFTELQRVVKLMKENPGLRVEIAAHTDDVGSTRYNQALSEKRAESVVQFLIDNQISPDRFEARGYGESDPRVPNDSEENRAVNRRVELRILEV